MVRQTIRWTFIWSMGIAMIFMLIYHFAGVSLVKVLTSDDTVIAASNDYLPWLLLMPRVGCAAFTWDGIYIGATESRKMRNSTIWAVVAFALIWGAGILLLNVYVPQETAHYGKLAMHVLMAAYFAHLLARTVYLTASMKVLLKS